MRIVVIGAYGYTAQLICAELARNGYNFAIAGKNKELLVNLQELYPSVRKIEIVDLTLENDCDILLSQYDHFINCAGPFTEESSLFLHGIASNYSKTYLDISGEIGFVRDSHNKYNALSKDNQSTIIHACAFESLLAGLAYQILKRKIGNPVSAETYYEFGRSRPSPGTKITMKMSNLRTLHFLKNGKWKPISETDKHSKKVLNKTYTAVPYPLPELPFFTWQDNLKDAASYLLLAPEEAIFSGQKKEVDIDLQDALKQLKERKGKGPDISERESQFAHLFVILSDGTGKSASLHLKANDMYAITAKCIILIMNKLDSISDQPFGVISPSILFENKEEGALKQLGVRLVETI